MEGIKSLNATALYNQNPFKMCTQNFPPKFPLIIYLLMLI